MPGFSEKLSAIKGKQEAANLKKKEEAEKATEAAMLERETKKSELATERDQVMAEFTQAKQTANEAREAVAQADAFANEQGENLDPEAKAEIEALKLEAGEAQQKFEELKIRLDSVNTKISAFEATAIETADIKTETPEAKSAVVEEAREFLDNQAKYGATGKEAVVGFLKERYPDLQPGTEQYSEAWDNLVQGIRFNNFKESAYFQKHGEISFNQFSGDRDKFTALAEFADRVEARKKAALDESNFTVQVKGEKEWETVTVDIDNLDALDDAIKEKFLTGLKNEKDRGIPSDKLSVLLEKGLLKPEEATEYIKSDRDITDLLSPEAIKKLRTNPALVKRIQQEVEDAASKVAEYSQKEPDMAAAYFAKILRAGVDDLDVQRTLLRRNIKPDGKAVLAKRLEETSQYNDPVASNRFTARDLGTFVKADVISREEFMVLAKRDVDWYRDNGVDAKGKYPAEYRNTERNLAEAVSEAYTYKKMGVISQEELDQLLAY